MGVKTGETRCPGCGAMVPFEEGQCQARCEYYGSPVTIGEDDQVIRNVDEADLKRAETEQLVRLKELELKEREQERAAKLRPLKLASMLVLGLIGAACLIVSSAVGGLLVLALMDIGLLSVAGVVALGISLSSKS